VVDAAASSIWTKTKRDPERIYQARIGGRRARTVSQWRHSGERAEPLLPAWEEEASTSGLDRGEWAFWDDGASLMEEEIR
jgi:hypothetical protein